MPRTEQPRIAILGAGPIGLEAALYAATLKLPFTVYERGNVGEHVRQWGHVRLFSPFAQNVTPLGLARIRADNGQHHFPADGDCVTGRDHLAAYLEPLALSPLLLDHIQTDRRVLAIGRQGLLKQDNPGDTRRAEQPFRLLVRDAKNQERVEEADVVLDCTGTYGRHRYLGHGGIPAVGELSAQAQIAYGVEDILGERRGHYADRTTLVLGSGYSAATTIGQLAGLAERHAGTWVVWLARRGSSQPIRRFVNDSLRERDLVAVRANQLATRADGNVEFHPQAHVEAVELRGGATGRESPDRGDTRPGVPGRVSPRLVEGTGEGFVVRATCAGKAMTFEVDRVIANVGYTPDADLYRELQVHECYVSLGPMGLAAALLKHSGGDGLVGPTTGPAVLRNPEPNFYVLGSKSYGRNSNFLLRAGFEQVKHVFTLITGRADLDLYRKR